MWKAAPKAGPMSTPIPANTTLSRSLSPIGKPPFTTANLLLLHPLIELLPFDDRQTQEVPKLNHLLLGQRVRMLAENVSGDRQLGSEVAVAPNPFFACSKSFCSKSAPIARFSKSIDFKM